MTKIRQTIYIKAIPVLVVCLVLTPYFLATARADPESVDPLKQANKLLELSKDQNLTNHPLAIETAQNALALFQSANDQVGIASSYALIGRYYYAQNSMIEASHFLESALQIWRQRQNTVEETNALITLGYIEGLSGEWMNGVSYLTQALNLVDEENEPLKMGQIISGMAFVFNESGLPEDGLKQFQRAKEYYQQAENVRLSTRSILM